MNAALFPSSGDAGVTATTSQTGVSWAAIFAGAFVAISTSLILLALGSGVGLASFSAWSGASAAAKSLTVNAAIWLIVSQWLSSALGGYIAGRLRTRWLGTHGHEVFFRDTAHGLITWSVATVVVSALLSGALWSAAAAGLNASSNLSGAAGVRPQEAYAVDVMFRPGAEAPTIAEAPTASAPLPRGEIERIVAHASAAGHLSDSDRSYLARIVAQHSGVAPAEAQKRVDGFFASVQDEDTRAREAAEKARTDAEVAALYVALSLVVGAFIGSVAAALGGRLRDLHP